MDAGSSDAAGDCDGEVVLDGVVAADGCDVKGELVIVGVGAVAQAAGPRAMTAIMATAAMPYFPYLLTVCEARCSDCMLAPLSIATLLVI